MSNVEHPSHYNQGGIECIDAIESAVCNLNGIDAYLVGNAIKYIWRHREKGGVESLEKAIWHLERQIDILIDEEDEQNYDNDYNDVYAAVYGDYTDFESFIDKIKLGSKKGDKDLHDVLESIAIALREPK
jgi:hypothetical protein